jgi:hypothetical protein
MASVQVQIEDKCLTIIKGLQLSWPAAAEIRCARLPWNVQGDGTVVISPGIVIYPLRPQFAAGTNRREDVGYGAGIAIIAPADHSTLEMRDRAPAAREAIRRKLVEDRFDTMDLVSGATYIQTKIGDTEVNIPKEAHRYEVSGLAVRCWVREPRT